VVWYPTIPPSNLDLNEDSFLPRDFFAVGYKPLFWSRFGGPGGEYLRHLTGISAVSCASILRIHFSFDVEVPGEHRCFGRLKFREEYEDSTEFQIDGPGGERIETIKIRYYPTPEESTPEGVEEGSMIQCEVSSSSSPPPPSPTPLSGLRSLFGIQSFIQTAGARAASSRTSPGAGKVTGSTAKVAASIHKSPLLQAPLSPACMPPRCVRCKINITPWQIPVTNINAVQHPDGDDEIDAMGVITEEVGEGDDA
jgi:hypothetical protein